MNFENRLEMSMIVDIGAAMPCIVCDSLVKFPSGSFATAREQNFQLQSGTFHFKNMCVKLIFMDSKQP
jgi:hypothetical protein